MPGWVKVNGSWKEVAEIHAKVGGSWKEVTEGYEKTGGIWELIYQGFEILLLKLTADTYTSIEHTSTYTNYEIPDYSSHATIVAAYAHLVGAGGGGQSGAGGGGGLTNYGGDRQGGGGAGGSAGTPGEVKEFIDIFSGSNFGPGSPISVRVGARGRGGDQARGGDYSDDSHIDGGDGENANSGSSGGDSTIAIYNPSGSGYADHYYASGGIRGTGSSAKGGYGEFDAGDGGRAGYSTGDDHWQAVNGYAAGGDGESGVAPSSTVFGNIEGRGGSGNNGGAGRDITNGHWGYSGEDGGPGNIEIFLELKAYGQQATEITGLSASYNDSSHISEIEVSWDASNFTTGYSIIRDTELLETNYQGTTYMDYVGDSETHSYYIKAEGEIDSEWSAGHIGKALHPVERTINVLPDPWWTTDWYLPNNLHEVKYAIFTSGECGGQGGGGGGYWYDHDGAGGGGASGAAGSQMVSNRPYPTTATQPAPGSYVRVNIGQGGGGGDGGRAGSQGLYDGDNGGYSNKGYGGWIRFDAVGVQLYGEDAPPLQGHSVPGGDGADPFDGDGGNSSYLPGENGYWAMGKNNLGEGAAGQPANSGLTGYGGDGGNGGEGETLEGSEIEPQDGQPGGDGIHGNIKLVITVLE